MPTGTRRQIGENLRLPFTAVNYVLCAWYSYEHVSHTRDAAKEQEGVYTRCAAKYVSFVNNPTGQLLLYEY